MVSGGCDSAVSTALLTSALGPEKVVALFIDNGFMRKNESSQVQESLEAIGLKLHGRQYHHHQEPHRHSLKRAGSCSKLQYLCVYPSGFMLRVVLQ